MRSPAPGAWAATLILASSLAAAPARAGGLARVRAAGVLRWGVDVQGGEPYAFDDPVHGGRLAGFEVDLAEALGRHLGVRAEPVQNDWSNLVPSLERGTFDVILNGLEATPARAGRILLSRPYCLFSERLVARRGDARIAGLVDLAGKRVGTLANTQAWDMLSAAGALPVPYEGVEEPFIDLEHGRTDAVLLDDIIVGRYAPRHPALSAVADVAEGRYVVGVRRGEEDLLRAVDEALAAMLDSGELRAILARWHIDGPRQAGLAAPGAVAGVRASSSQPAPRSAAAAGATAPARRLGAVQLLLFLEGALATLLVSVGAMAVAVPLGLLLAALRLYGARPARALATAYVEVLRGTPVLLQLYLLYYGLADVISLPAPVAAILGLGLNYAAYEAEVYRGGIQAVPRGQIEAALTLGMPLRLALRRIVLPQAFRFALPGVTNDFIALLKDSSLVSVITVVELTKRMTILAVDVRGWLAPGLLCAGLYFAMSYPLSLLARRLEARLGSA